MIKISVITGDLREQNSLAFVAPIIKNLKLLKGADLDISFLKSVDGHGLDSNVLLVDGSVFRSQWRNKSEEVQKTLAYFNTISDRVIYADVSDSTGWVKRDVFPYIDLFVKNQLLRDRKAYLKAQYGCRLYTDWIHQNYGVTDTSNEVNPPLVSEQDLNKLVVGWNSSLANYAVEGLCLGELYRRLRLPQLLRAPFRFVAPTKNRPIQVSCRISSNYSRETIAWQRKKAIELLSGEILSARISRWRYFKELENSQIVISPFGFGEINYKDYEAFVSGAALLKPSMAHLETWPNLWVGGETIAEHGWGLEDFKEKLDRLLQNPTSVKAIATAAQEKYRKYLVGRMAGELFVKRFTRIIDTATGMRPK